MGDFALITFGVALGLAALMLSLARATDAAAADWEAVISPRGLHELELLRHRFAVEQDALDFAYERAHETTDSTEVAAMLAIGYDLVAEVARDRRQLLRQAALYSRLVSVLVPLPPLRPRGFRLKALASTAGAATLLHHLLFTAGSRYRLRLSVLRRGLGIVAVTIGRGARPLEAPRWQELEAARADWRTLSGETLESFRSLVTAAVEVGTQEATALARR